MENYDRVKKLKELNCLAKNLLVTEFEGLSNDYETFREMFNVSYRRLVECNNRYYNPHLTKKHLVKAEKSFNSLLNQQNKILKVLTKINKQRRLLKRNKVSKQVKLF